MHAENLALSPPSKSNTYKDIKIKCLSHRHLHFEETVAL